MAWTQRRWPLSAAQSHLPSYVRDYQKLRDMGVDVIACVATNGAFIHICQVVAYTGAGRAAESHTRAAGRAGPLPAAKGAGSAPGVSAQA